MARDHKSLHVRNLNPCPMQSARRNGRNTQLSPQPPRNLIPSRIFKGRSLPKDTYFLIPSRGWGCEWCPSWDHCRHCSSRNPSSMQHMERCLAAIVSDKDLGLVIISIGVAALLPGVLNCPPSSYVTVTNRDFFHVLLRRLGRSLGWSFTLIL